MQFLTVKILRIQCSSQQLTLLGAGGTGGLVLVRGGVKNTPPQNLKISGSEAQHV